MKLCVVCALVLLSGLWSGCKGEPVQGNEARCGDGVCRVGELSEGSCPQDCTDGAPVCGDATCEAGEGPQSCPEDCSGFVEVHTCNEPQTLLQVLPGRIDLALEETPRATVFLRNAGASALCLDADALRLEPAELPAHLVEALPARVAPGEIVELTVEIDPEARGFWPGFLTVGAVNAPEVTISLNVEGGPLSPEDVTRPEDLPPGTGFVILVVDGEEIATSGSLPFYFVNKMNGHGIVEVREPRDPRGPVAYSNTRFMVSMTLTTMLEADSPEVMWLRFAFDGIGTAQVLEGELPRFEVTRYGGGTLSGFVMEENPQINVAGVGLKAFYVHNAPCGDCEDCTNGVDDDGDLAIDCNDDDCSDSRECRAEDDCGDGVDNDEDGRIDCEDLDCRRFGPCREQDCADGRDNDEDGVADCDDDDCLYNSACGEEDCSNGVDENGDGSTDCQDLSCQVALTEADDPRRAPCLEACDDGVDNNGDGLIDCEAFNCREQGACHAAPSCPGVSLSARTFEGRELEVTHFHPEPVTVDALDPSCGFGGFPEQTYRLTAPTDGTYLFWYQGLRLHRLTMALLDGGCGGEELACENFDSTALIYQKTLTVTLRAGQEVILVIEDLDETPDINYDRIGVGYACQTSADCPAEVPTCAPEATRAITASRCVINECTRQADCPEGHFCARERRACLPIP